MKIAVDINPDADGVRCGECCVAAVADEDMPWCDQHIVQVPHLPGWHTTELHRGPGCLAATQRYQRLTEALREARETLVDADQFTVMSCDCDACKTARKIDAILADEVKP